MKCTFIMSETEAKALRGRSQVNENHVLVYFMVEMLVHYCWKYFSTMNYPCQAQQEWKAIFKYRTSNPNFSTQVLNYVKTFG